MSTVLATGYAAIDILHYRGKYSYAAGGSAANVAANLSWLGWGASLCGAIGDDASGRFLVRDLEGLGVDCSLLVRSAGRGTPELVHKIEPSGGHRFAFRCPSCGRSFPKFSPFDSRLTAQVIEVAGGADVLYFDRASKGSVALAEAFRDAGRLVFFEPSARGRLELFEAAVRCSHIVKVTAEHAVEFEDRLGPRAAAQVRIETRGARGLVVESGVNERSVLPAFRVGAIDSAGAGDWTTAGLLAALPSLKPEELNSQALVRGLTHAQALAAASCLYPGARGMAYSDLARLPEDLRIDVEPLGVSGDRRIRRRPSQRPGACSVCFRSESHQTSAAPRA